VTTGFPVCYNTHTPGAFLRAFLQPLRTLEAVARGTAVLDNVRFVRFNGLRRITFDQLGCTMHEA
jgi:hypothetical protein